MLHLHGRVRSRRLVWCLWFVVCKSPGEPGSAIFVACNCVFHRHCIEEWRALKDEASGSDFLSVTACFFGRGPLSAGEEKEGRCCHGPSCRIKAASHYLLRSGKRTTDLLVPEFSFTSFSLPLLLVSLLSVPAGAQSSEVWNGPARRVTDIIAPSTAAVSQFSLTDKTSAVELIHLGVIS